MKCFALMTGSAMLALAMLPAAASAESVNAVVTVTTGSVTVLDLFDPVSFDFSSQQIDEAIAGVEFTGGGIQSTSRVAPDAVEFQNGIMVAGPSAYATAFTEVKVTFTNNTDTAVTPTLVTVLDPLGLGFYIADLGSGGSGPCTAATLNTCPQSTAATFAQVGTGKAGFKFKIFDNSRTIYELNGSMTAVGDGTIDDTDMAAASAELVNFRKATPPGDPSAFGYQWDVTPKTLTLDVLAPHTSNTLIYWTTTYAQVDGPCASENTASATCLAAFSAFGDPFKGGNTGTNISTASFATVLDDFDTIDLTGGINGVFFNTLAPLYLPKFDPVTGNLAVFLPTTDDGLIAPPGIPEPASWAMMISGFGLVGGALRRRRAVAA